MSLAVGVGPQHRWCWSVVTALIAAVGWMSAAPAAASDTAPWSATVRTSGYETDRVVSLSFDAGSDAGDVASILGTLRAQGITAGFGLSGRFVEQFPSAARAIAADGHTVFNHSYSHPDFTTLTQAQRFAELDRTEAAFRAAGLRTARWFRAPFKAGYADSGLNRDLALRGSYVNFDWTYDTTGYTGASVATILSRVRTYTRPGTIVLGHVGAASTDAEALPDVIRTLREMGYRFTDPSRTLTYGAIRPRYDAVRFLGAPRTVEMATSGGRVQWFDGGRIYWSTGTGAREVYGAILGTYLRHADTAGFLGFPVTGELPTPDGPGRYNHFQGGSVYWSPTTGAWEVHGAIRAKWAELGWERSRLGYPISDEYAIAGGRRSNFQNGYITWTATGGAVVQ